MRIDLALKYLCLAKSRLSVKSLCDAGGLLLNRKSTKPSSTVHVGDVIALRGITVEILEVPSRQLSKAAAPSYYRVVAEEDRTSD